MKYFFLISLIWSSFTHSQDERFWYDWNKKQSKQKKLTETKWKVRSELYYADLNFDGKQEEFYTEKRDSIDYLVISKGTKELVREFEFKPFGFNAGIEKIRSVSLSSEINAIIVTYNEGSVDSVEFQSRGQVFVITWNRKTKKVYFTQGPFYRDEKAKIRDHYHFRFYETLVKDINKDGIKEIGINYKSIFSLHNVQR